MKRVRPGVLLSMSIASLAMCLALGTSARADTGEAVAGTPTATPDATAVPPAAPIEPDLRAYVVTLGPGDHPFFKFGHNALWLQSRQGGDAVYNFGTFAFDTPGLIPKFVLGRFRYWLSVAGIDDTLWHYRNSNRTIELQELALSPAERVELDRRLRENARPENREYLYDYFWDNCSTRVRDAVNAATGGRLKTALQAMPAQQTFRQHALRLTADVTWEYLALHFVLSGASDRLYTAWEESFIPEIFQRALREVTLPAANGGAGKLIAAERVVFAPRRAPPLATPPQRMPYFLLAGLLGGGGLYGLAWLGRRRRGARVLTGLATAGLGLVMGLLGTILLFIWFFTNHVSCHGNENALLVAPWLLGLAWYGVGVARGRARATRIAMKLVAAAVASTLLAVLLKPLPWFVQDNWAFVLFFLPLWLGLAAGLRRLSLARDAAAAV